MVLAEAAAQHVAEAVGPVDPGPRFLGGFPFQNDTTTFDTVGLSTVGGGSFSVLFTRDALLEVFPAFPYWCDHEPAPGSALRVSRDQWPAVTVFAFSSPSFVAASHAGMLCCALVFTASGALSGTPRQNCPPMGFK